MPHDGHSLVPHTLWVVSASHGVPPSVGATTTVRVADCVPEATQPALPPGASHGVNVPKALSLQSTGHPCVAQCSEAVRAGHCVPALAACLMTRRARVRLPPPHEREQAPQSDQRETVQCTGHGPPVLQYCDCESVGQPLPPLSALRVTTRTRV